MAYMVDNTVLDDGLNELTNNVTELHVCSALPTDRANCLAVSLGQKVTPTVGAPTDHTTGRKVVVTAITDGDIDATGTATHWALISGTLLLASQTLSAGVGVTSGHKFTLDSFFVAIPTA